MNEINIKTKKLFSAAETDYSDASYLYDSGRFNNSYYHSHQACEKFMKSILCELDIIVPRTHNLEELSNKLGSVGVNLPIPIISELQDISEIAFLIRYGDENATISDAKQAFSICLEIRKIALRFLDSRNNLTQLTSFTTNEHKGETE